MNELDQMLDELKALRETAAQAQEAKNKIIEQVKAQDEYKAADELKAQTDEQIVQLEAQIRSTALELYDCAAELPSRVTVKWFKTVKYNANVAREWCMKNFTPALTLDTKTFEKAAKDGTIPADIASVSKEARAQIATKL